MAPISSRCMLRESLIALSCAITLSFGANAQEAAPLRWLKLERDTIVDGIRCGPTGRAKATFFPSGKLQACPLASDTVLFDYEFSAGTWIYLTEAGVLSRAWLSRDTALQGHACRGTGYKGWSVEFYPSGGLKLCYLADQEVIQSVPCRRASFWGEISGGVQVSFHENGQLESCGAARDFTLDSITFRKHQRVWLDLDGHPVRGKDND
jgi:hypothetical protein